MTFTFHNPNKLRFAPGLETVSKAPSPLGSEKASSKLKKPFPFFIIIRLTGPYLFRGRVEPRKALLRERSLAPLHSLQGSKPFFNIGDNERGRDGRDQTRE
ncbi:hypothetical protein LIER_37244 [Lithospermum erythrorhizon]|uniref:Uncharacterized protein n=1 Tax=Lithospermum erythrorhizon TaxID=34254 RepID=A0AAV3PHK3_LITER